MNPRLLDLSMTARDLHHLMTDFKRLGIDGEKELRALGNKLTEAMSEAGDL